MKDRVLVIATTSTGWQTNIFSLTDDQPMLLLGPPVASGTETDTQTGAETETDAEIQTGIETGAETGAASGSGAGVEPKAKRQRVPNKLRTTRVVVTEVDDGNFEPTAPEEASMLRQSNRLHRTDNRHHQR